MPSPEAQISHRAGPEMINAHIPFVICPAQPSDAPAMVAVHQEAYVQGYENNEEPEFGATRKALRAFVEGEFAERKLNYWGEAALRGAGVYVARLCSNVNGGLGEIIGIGEGIDDEITGLYVRTACHRRGIGKALLQATCADLQKHTIRLIVTRWAPAVTFYEKYGFKLTDRPIPAPKPPKAYGITLEQIEMKKLLLRA